MCGKPEPAVLSVMKYLVFFRWFQILCCDQNDRAAQNHLGGQAVTILG